MFPGQLCLLLLNMLPGQLCLLLLNMFTGQIGLLQFKMFSGKLCLMQILIVLILTTTAVTGPSTLNDSLKIDVSNFVHLTLCEQN